MITSVLIFIQSHILPLGALGVFLACALDEISMVVPASVVLITTGFIFLRPTVALTHAAFLKTLFLTIALPAALGLTIGSLVIYAIAYIGGKPIIERFGRFVKVSWTDIEALDRRMSQSHLDEWFIFLAWVFPVLPSAVLNIFCGATRIEPRKYALLTLSGTFLKSIIMALIGFWAGRLYFRYAAIIDHFEIAIAAVIIVAALYIWKIKKGKKILENMTGK